MTSRDFICMTTNSSPSWPGAGSRRVVPGPRVGKAGMRRKNMEFSQNSVGGRARKENGEMRNVRCTLLAGSVLVFIGLLAEAGCYHTPVDNSEFARGPAPLRMPSPGKQAETCDCYEDSLTGGQVF